MYESRFEKIEKGGCISDMKYQFNRISKLISKGKITSNEEFYRSIKCWPEYWEMDFWAYAIKNNKNITEFAHMSGGLAKSLLEDGIIDFAEVGETFLKYYEKLDMPFREYCYSYIARRAGSWLDTDAEDYDKDFPSNYISTEKPWYWYPVIYITLIRLDLEMKFTLEIEKYIRNKI